MNRCFFPLHLNGNNRGCEAICRGTINVLDLQKNNYIGLCTDLNIDSKLGLEKIATLCNKESIDFIWRLKNKIIRSIPSKNEVGIFKYYSKIYDSFLNNIQSNDICFITGGDMLCYGDNEINYIVDRLHKENKKVVLWGASLGKENLTNRKTKILTYFDCIIARESLTYDMLSNYLKLDNIYKYPDPAFSLKCIEISLPDFFSKKCIGINISNFITKNIYETNYYNALCNLVNYILNETSYNVILFPHVFWKKQDDREICKHLLNKYKNEDRIFVFNTIDYNYCEIRYAISKCEAFIGARTHSMISAYSTCTPSIALGYSIKSKGIANDLELNDKLVVNYKSISNDKDLIIAFEYLMNNITSIKKQLVDFMPEYINNTYNAKEIIYNL